MLRDPYFQRTDRHGFRVYLQSVCSLLLLSIYAGLSLVLGCHPSGVRMPRSGIPAGSLTVVTSSKPLLGFMRICAISPFYYVPPADNTAIVLQTDLQ